MLMECREARRLMHAELDNDITPLEKQALGRHVAACTPCAEAQHSLRSTVEGLSLLAASRAPVDFTASVMQQIQPVKKGVGRRWTRLLATAAMLVFLIGSPLYYVFTMAYPQIILDDPRGSIALQGGIARVAAGQVVSGDITIYKAELVIAGEVTGNIKVIDGNVRLESGGHVQGTITEVPVNMSGKLKLAVAELWDDIRHIFAGR